MAEHIWKWIWRFLQRHKELQREPDIKIYPEEWTEVQINTVQFFHFNEHVHIMIMTS